MSPLPQGLPVGPAVLMEARDTGSPRCYLHSILPTKQQVALMCPQAPDPRLPAPPPRASPTPPHGLPCFPRASPHSRHLKGLPEHQREDIGHLLLAPVAALEGVGHYGGAGEPGLDVEDDVPRLRQEVDLKPAGIMRFVRAADGWAVTRPRPRRGHWGGRCPLLVLSRVRVSLD